MNEFTHQTRTSSVRSLQEMRSPGRWLSAWKGLRRLCIQLDEGFANIICWDPISSD